MRTSGRPHCSQGGAVPHQTARQSSVGLPARSLCGAACPFRTSSGFATVCIGPTAELGTIERSERREDRTAPKAEQCHTRWRVNLRLDFPRDLCVALLVRFGQAVALLRRATVRRLNRGRLSGPNVGKTALLPGRSSATPDGASIFSWTFRAISVWHCLSASDKQWLCYGVHRSGG